MKADIIGLKLNTSKQMGNGKTYDGHIVTYQPEPYQGKAKEPVEKFIFANSEVAKDIVQLDVGDQVEITFVKDGKYSNPVSFKVIKNKPASAPSIQSAATPRTDDKADSIARAVALKEGMNIVTTITQAGGYTAAKIKQREFLQQEVLAASRAFLPFLLNQESTDAVLLDKGAVYYPDDEQESFGDVA